MKRIYSLTTLLIFSVISILAQHSIQSNVFNEKNGLALEFSTVRLLNAKDSSFVQGTRTNGTGTFIIPKVKPGSYIVAISMLGYKDYFQNVTVDKKDVIMKNIQMTETAHALGIVEVTGAAAQMVVKGDTTEYNATAFKTAQNAVVEDLLKKLPGVEVSSEGKITVNGQEIKKIRIDGKKFFGDDIEMATKNIPADMIDKIQVHDQKSDMAQLTGFEDNDTERIINLTTKANRKHGIFGNITGGAGEDINNNLRYDGNAFINIMDGEAQTAITAGGNNTNTSRSGRGRAGMGGPAGGITETQNFGVNNNTSVNSKLKLGGDASLNHSDNYSTTETNKQTYVLDALPNTNSSKSTSNIGNYSANLRLEAEWKPDTLNTIILQPTIGYNRSFTDSNSSFNYLTGVDTTSIGSARGHGNGSSINANMNVILSHKFTSKRGRALTANISTGLSQNNNESWNISNKTSLGTPTNVNQYTTNSSNQFNANLRVSYIEPLWNVRNLLETAVSVGTTGNDAEKNQYNRNDTTGNYFVGNTAYTLDNNYSNTFKNRFYRETMELNYRYVAKNYNLMLGIKADPSQTSYNRLYANGTSRDTTYGVFNFAPTGRFQYNFLKRKFIRIDYRGQTNQPSLSQMQPVKNNSNLMNEIVGNPNLNPEFNHNFRMFYSAFNDSTFSSFNAMINAQVTKDALIANSIYDSTGKQYSQTVNSNIAPVSIFGNIMFNTPVIPKRLQFNTNTSLGYDRRYGYSKRNVSTINTDLLLIGDLSNTRKYTANEALSLTFTTDALEIGSRGSVRYSNTYNNLSNATSQTYDWTIAGNVVVHLPYNINIASDMNYTTLQGYSNFDKNQLIWNASIDKSFFNNKGVLALKMFDILHQQLNIRQTIGDNYISYSKFNTLTSYFMLSFSYKINKFNGSRNPARQDFERFGPNRDGGGDRQFRRGNRGGNDGPPSF